jgi:hypothetical protein
MYPGWDKNTAHGDWVAKGRPMPGGGSGSSGTSGSSGPSQEEILLQEQLDTANQLYNDLTAGLDRQAGLFGDLRQSLEQRINELAQTQRSDIDSERDLAQSRIGDYRQQVRQDQGSTLRDLSADMRNALRAGQMRLGSAGAGSSSAAPMYSYALSKQANQRRGDVMAQTRELMNQLNMKEEDVKNTFVQQKNELDRWKANQLAQVEQDYTNQLSQIESMRGQAATQKRELQNQALQNALNRLNELDLQAAEWESSMKQWATNRTAQLNDYKAKLGQLTNFNPQQLAYQELQSGLQGVGRPGGQFDLNAYNPYARRKKEQEEIYGVTFGA